eukprot:502877-Pyramimonas_sp.AAC.1
MGGSKDTDSRTSSKVYRLSGRSALGYSLLPTPRSVSNGTKKNGRQQFLCYNSYTPRASPRNALINP